MTSTDTKYSTHIHFDKKSNTKDFKFCYHVRIFKYKYILTKGYVQIQPKEAFLTKEVKNTVLLACVISYSNNEEIVGTFYKKELQEANKKKVGQKKCLIENMINYMKRKVIQQIYTENYTAKSNLKMEEAQ